MKANKKRMYFNILDDDYIEYNAHIKDGTSIRDAKSDAIKFMRANGIKFANLQVNDMATDDIIDTIEINL